MPECLNETWDLHILAIGYLGRLGSIPYPLVNETRTQMSDFYLALFWAWSLKAGRLCVSSVSGKMTVVPKCAAYSDFPKPG